MYRLIAYLGILASIILGGILGIIALVLAFGALEVDLGIVHLLIGIALGAFLSGVLAVIHVRRYLKTQGEKQFAKYLASVPENVGELIKSIIRQMRYRKKVQDDVMTELAAHFEDELKDCRTDEERQQKAQRLIAEFGDAKLLAVLLRRAKKRCRPLWQTIVARTFQTIGILILCFIIYTAWFISGKANPKIDYLVEINQRQRIQKAIMSDKDNAWLNYNKAAQLFIKPNQAVSELIDSHRRFPGDGELTEAEKTLVTEWLNQNEPVWQQFIAGSKKPYYYFEMEYEDYNKQEKDLSVVAYPIHQFWYHLRELWLWRIRMETKQGNIEQALEDCLLMLRVARHVAEDNYWLLEHMMAAFSTKKTVNAILYIVSTNKLSAEQLRLLQEQLTLIFPEGYPTMTLFIEVAKMHALDATQRYFTDGGPGGGHLIPRKLEKYFNWVLDNRKPGFEKMKFVSPYVLSMVHAMVHAGRDETIAKSNEIYDQLIEIMKMTPYERYVRNIATKDIILSLPEYRFFFIRIGMPILDGGFDAHYYQVKSQYEATLTILALQRWRLVKGRYPQSLDDLVTEGYLKQLPMDPYSVKPLTYKKKDGGFILYSIGPNFTDDGGQMSRDDKGRVKLWSNEGDAVFWPVQKI